MEQTLAPVITSSSPQEKDWIFDQLIRFNRDTLAMTPETYSQPLNFHLRAQDDRIVAGINATMLGQASVYVAILWVDAQQRGRDYGTLLLQHVETKAREHGAQLVHLDTFDFQAKDFYIKQGYTMYAELDDSPTAGHTRYYFCKRLGA